MENYDPDETPEPEEWLDLDEQERIALVEQFHERARVRLPNATLHAIVHTIVENQLALPEPVVVATMARLREEGFDRHEAIHAIGFILTAQMLAIMKDPRHARSVPAAYHAGLQALSAESWRAQ